MRKLVRIPADEGSVRNGYRREYHAAAIKVDQTAGPAPTPAVRRRRSWQSPEGLSALCRIENAVRSLSSIAGASDGDIVSVCREDLVGLGVAMDAVEADMLPGLLDATR